MDDNAVNGENNAAAYPTLEMVAQHFASTLVGEDRQYVASGKNDMDLVNRAIRNDYSLWYFHPLTKNWRDNESGRDIRDGVDYSADHPDNMSEQIRERVVLILNS